MEDYIFKMLFVKENADETADLHLSLPRFINQPIEPQHNQKTFRAGYEIYDIRNYLYRNNHRSSQVY